MAVAVIYFSLSVLVIRQLLFFPGILFFNEVGIPPFPSLQLQNARYLFAWNEFDFGSIITRQMSMYTRSLQILTGMIGLDGAKVTTLFILLNLGLSGYSMFYLIKILGLPKDASFISGLFYMFNPLIFHEIVYGHIPDFIFSYSFFPLLFSFLVNSFRERKYSLLLLSVFFVPFSTATVHMLFIAIILPPLFLLAVCQSNLKRKIIWIFTYFMLIFSVHSPWILSNAGSVYGRLQMGEEVYGFSQTMYLSAEPYQAWINIGYSERHFSEKVGINLLGNCWYIFGYTMTIFSFIPLLINPKERKVLFFSSLLLLAIGIMFIFKTPLGACLYGLYSLVPTVNILFRNPTNFAYIHAISLSILLGFSLASFQHSNKNLAKRHLIVTILMFLLIFSFGIPFFTGDFGGYYRSYDCQPYENMINYFTNEQEAVGRVMLYPPDKHIRYDPTNSLWEEEPKHWSIDPISLLFPWPTVSLRSEDRTSPSYILPIYLYYTIHNENKETLARLLGNLDIEYFIVRKNVNSPLEKFSSIKLDTLEVEKTLLEAEDFIPIERINNTLTIFKNTKLGSKLFIASTTCLSDYRDLKALLELDKHYAIIFPPLQFSLESDAIEKVLIKDLSGKSLILNFIPTDNIILPSQYVKEFNPSQYFVPYFYEGSWYNNFYFSRFVHPFSIMGLRENVTIDIPLEVSLNENFYLAVNYLREERQSSVKIIIEDNIFYLTGNDGSEPSWEIIGPFNLHEGNHILRIINEKGRNLINYLLVFPQQTFDEASDRASLFLENKTIHYPLMMNENLIKKIVELNVLKEGDHILYFMYSLKKPTQLKVTLEDHSFFLQLEKGENMIYLANLTFDRTEVYHLILNSIIDNLIENGSFEESYSRWRIPNKGFEVLLDENGIDGKYALRVSTNISTKNTWSWIRSELINVTNGDEYLIVTNMKYTNVKSSHIVIEGYFESENNWKQLKQVPRGKSDTDGWQKFESYLTIPENVSKIRIVLNAGFVKNPEEGDAITWFDGIEIFAISQIPQIKEGILINGDIDIATSNKSAEMLKYIKINPTKYVVNVNATKPFMLSFVEAYSPLWVARVNGQKIRSISLYSIINGFWIDQIGELTITIEYEPQRWFYMGSAISVTALIACAIYLTHDWAKNKDGLKGVRKWSRSNSL